MTLIHPQTTTSQGLRSHGHRSIEQTKLAEIDFPRSTEARDKKGKDKKAKDNSRTEQWVADSRVQQEQLQQRQQQSTNPASRRPYRNMPATALTRDEELRNQAAASALQRPMVRAKPVDLPSFPTVGIANPGSSAGVAANLAVKVRSPDIWQPDKTAAAGAAASLAKANTKSPEIWHPDKSAAASAAAVLAKASAPEPYQPPPLPNSMKAARLSAAGAAASLKHSQESQQPSSPQSRAVLSAATNAVSAHPQANHHATTDADGDRSLTRARAGSQPVQPHSPKPSADVLRAATISMKSASDKREAEATELARALTATGGLHRSGTTVSARHGSDEAFGAAAAEQNLKKEMAFLNARMSEVDAAKLEKDNEALLAAAYRITQEKLDAMDEAAAGRGIPQRADWTAVAKDVAERRHEQRSKIHLGFGKTITQEEVDNIARLHVQPVLDEISNEAERKIAHDEEMRIQREKEERERQEKLEWERQTREEQKRARAIQKEEEQRRKAEQKMIQREEREAYRAAERERKDEERRKQEAVRDKERQVVNARKEVERQRREEEKRDQMLRREEQQQRSEEERQEDRELERARREEQAKRDREEREREREEAVQRKRLDEEEAQAERERERERREEELTRQRSKTESELESASVSSKSTEREVEPAAMFEEPAERSPSKSIPQQGLDESERKEEEKRKRRQLKEGEELRRDGEPKHGIRSWLKGVLHRKDKSQDKGKNRGKPIISSPVRSFEEGSARNVALTNAPAESSTRSSPQLSDDEDAGVAHQLSHTTDELNAVNDRPKEHLTAIESSIFPQDRPSTIHDDPSRPESRSSDIALGAPLTASSIGDSKLRRESGASTAREPKFHEEL